MKTIGEFWDEEADNTAKNLTRDYGKTVEELWYFLGQVKVKENSNIVDFGCGIGRYAKPLANGGHQVMAVDISVNMLVKAKEYCEGIENISFCLTEGMGCELVPDGWADLVISQFVFQHLPTWNANAECLLDLHRMLKPGGRAVIQSRDTGSEEDILDVNTMAGRRVSCIEFLTIAVRAGFTPITVLNLIGNPKNKWYKMVLEK